MSDDLPVDYYGTVTASTDQEYTKAVPRDKHEVLIDEPTTMDVGAGNDDYPSPVDHMALSLATCQVSILAQALERARVEEFDITCDYDIGNTEREDVGEEMHDATGTRVRHINVDITLEVADEDESRAQRCLDAYDVGCIVGQSFKAGIDYTPETELVVKED